MKVKLMLVQTLKVLGLFFVLFFSFLMGEIIKPYFSWRTDIDFLLTKQLIVHLKHYMGAFYIHIFSSLFVLLAGATQFSRNLMKVYPKVHRGVGMSYVVIILFISAPGAMIMSYYANGGMIGRINFITLTTLWWFFTLWAFTSARKGNIIAHGNWMIRSYTLTLSAVFLRIFQYASAYVHIPLDANERYILFSILSWVPPLIIIELIIRKFDLSKRILKGL